MCVFKVVSFVCTFSSKDRQTNRQINKKRDIKTNNNNNNDVYFKSLSYTNVLFKLEMNAQFTYLKIFNIGK
jgi:hypothetical protein